MNDELMQAEVDAERFRMALAEVGVPRHVVEVIPTPRGWRPAVVVRGYDEQWFQACRLMSQRFRPGDVACNACASMYRSFMEAARHCTHAEGWRA